MKNEIKIMTFNIRSAICEDGINDFRYRAKKTTDDIPENGVYLSDHYPLTAVLEMK